MPSFAVIAEPSRARANQLQTLVESFGLEAVVVRNGDEAVSLFQRIPPPKVALINLMLPRLDGVALVRRVRALGIDVPVILFAPVPTVAEGLKQYDFSPLHVLLTSSPLDDVREALRKFLPESSETGARGAADAAAGIQSYAHHFAQELIAQFDVAVTLVTIPWGGRRFAGIGVRPPRMALPEEPTSEPLLEAVASSATGAVVVPDLRDHQLFPAAALPGLPFRGIAGMSIATGDAAPGHAWLADFRPLALDALALDRFTALVRAASAELSRMITAKRASDQRAEIEERAALERAEANARIAALSEVAIKDALTGLMNRRGGEQALAREAARVGRTGAPLGLVMLDLDRFKGINDRFGHAAGDEALKRVAATIESLQRASDLSVRWGGDEFLVLLPDEDAGGARMFAERVRSAVETVGGGAAQLTISLGAGELTTRDTVASVLVEVDRRLYEAKKTGGNAVR